MGVDVSRVCDYKWGQSLGQTQSTLVKLCTEGKGQSSLEEPLRSHRSLHKWGIMQSGHWSKYVSSTSQAPSLLQVSLLQVPLCSLKWITGP